MVSKRALLAAAVCAVTGCRLPSALHAVPSNALSRAESREPDSDAERIDAEEVPPAAAPSSRIHPASYQAGGDANSEDGPDGPSETSQIQTAPEPLTEIPLLPSEQPSMGSLDAFEQMALESNPSLQEATARVNALRGKWVQAGLAPNTVLGYSGQQLGSGGEAEQQGLFVGQEFVRGGKLALQRAVVAQEIRRAEQQRSAQQLRILTDVRLGYYEVLIAQRRVQVAEELVRIARETESTAESLLAAREVSQIDVMRAKIELQTAQLLLKNAGNVQDAAWSRLTAVVGQPDLPFQPLGGPLEGPFQSLAIEQTLQELLAQSPEMAAAIVDIDRARWNLSRQRAEPIPNLDVQAVAQADNGTGSANANLQVTFPLPCLDRNQGAIRQAYSELRAARLASERVRLGLQRRLATVYQRYANASNQVNDYSRPDGILDNSRKTLEFIRKGYQAGEIGYLDLLTGQRTYAEANLAYLESLGEFWSALIEIDGLLLRDSLEESDAGVSIDR